MAVIYEVNWSYVLSVKLTQKEHLLCNEIANRHIIGPINTYKAAYKIPPN